MHIYMYGQSFFIYPQQQRGPRADSSEVVSERDFKAKIDKTAAKILSHHTTKSDNKCGLENLSCWFMASIQK